MSLIPRWFSHYPRPGRRPSDYFNLSKLLEEMDTDLTPFSSYPSGLSVSSDDKNIYIEAHVPGLTSEDVEVSIDNDNVLWIKGEKKEQVQDKKKKYWRESQRSFSYGIPLGPEVDTQVTPEAEVDKGVIYLTFPKKKEKQAEAKKIRVREKNNSA